MSDITAARPARNGVDVPTLFATLDAVKANPQIADFQFRARNTWVSGTHNRTTIQGFYGAGQEDTSRTEPFVLRRRPPGRPGRQQQGADPGRVPAARDRGLPDRRAWRTSPPPAG